MPNGNNDQGKWAEGLWEHRVRQLWAKAQEGRLGGQFWAEVAIDPETDPMSLTEEQVNRLATEIERIERLYPQVFIPYYRQEWIRAWKVPEPKRWTDVPIAFDPRKGAEVGYRGLWQDYLGKMTLTEEGIEPSTIAHEMAHKRYFELPPMMRKEVDKILDWYERTSPEFRRWTMGQGTKEWRKRPVERHAMLYQFLGRDPEKIPYYLDKYYEGLKPWKITEGLGARRWALREGQISREEFYRHPWERREQLAEKQSRWQDILKRLGIK